MNSAHERKVTSSRRLLLALSMLLGLQWLLLTLMLDAAFRLPLVGRVSFWVVSLVLIALTVRISLQHSEKLPRSRFAWALLAAFFCCLAIAYVPSASGHLRRAIVPWSEAPAMPASYRIVVSSGNVVALAGEQVSLGGYLVPLGPNVAFPTVIQWRHGDETKTLPIAPDGSFAITLAAHAGHYTFRTDQILSDEYSITVHAASDWLPDSRIVVSIRQTSSGPMMTLRDVPISEFDRQPSVVRGCILSGNVRFPATVVDASVVQRVSAVEKIPVPVHWEGQSLTFEFPVEKSAELLFRVQLADGSVVTKELNILVKNDQLPTVLSARSWRQPIKREATPGAQVAGVLRLVDDVGIASVMVELEAAPGEPALAPQHLTTTDGQTWPYRVILPKQGTTVRSRLVIRELGTESRTVTLPTQGWIEYTLTPTARSVREQLIAEDRDTWETTTKNISSKLLEALRELNRKEALSAEQEALDNVTRAVAEFDTLLHDFEHDRFFEVTLKRHNTLRGQTDQASASLRLALRESKSLTMQEARTALSQTLIDWLQHWGTTHATQEDIRQRRLAASMLDQERERLSQGVPTSDEIVAARTRLETRFAQYPLLHLARTDALLSQRADAVVRCRSLYAAHRDWWQQFHELQTKARTQRTATLFHSFRKLIQQSEATRVQANTSAELLGLPTIETAWHEETTNSFQRSATFDILTDCQKSANAWERAADRLQDAVQQRVTPREATRQLLAAIEDFTRRRRLDPAQAILAEWQEYVQFVSCYTTPDAAVVDMMNQVTALLQSSTSEKMLDEKLRSLSLELKRWQSEQPTNEVLTQQEREAWSQWKKALATALRNFIGDVPAVPRVRFVSSEAYFALQTLRQRVLDEDKLTTREDAKQTLFQLARYADTNAETTPNRIEPETLLTELLAEQHRVVADTRETNTDAERTSLSDRQRQISNRLSSLTNLLVEPLLPELIETSRRVEDDLRQRRPTLDNRLASIQQILLLVTKSALGIISDVDRLRAIETWIGECVPAEAKVKRRRMIDMILPLHFGTKVEASRALVKLLERGPRSKSTEDVTQYGTEIRTAFQQALAALEANPLACCSVMAVGPPTPSEATRLTHTAAGRMPSQVLCQMTRQVAVDVRNLRDQVSLASDDRHMEPLTDALRQDWKKMTVALDTLLALEAQMLTKQLLPNEDTAMRAAREPLMRLAEMWQTINIDQVCQRQAQANIQEQAATGLLMRAVFRNVTPTKHGEAKSAKLGQALDAIVYALDKGDVPRALDALRAASELLPDV